MGITIELAANVGGVEMEPAYQKGSSIGIYSHDEYLLSTYNVPGTVPGAGNTVVHGTVSSPGDILRSRVGRTGSGRKIYIKEEYNVR